MINLKTLAFATSLACALVAALGLSSAQAQKSGNQASADCTAMASTVWLQAFTVVATSSGSCGQADVLLKVSRSDGSTVIEDAYAQEQVFEIAWAQTQDEMAASLAAWIGDYADPRATDTLPPWAAGSDLPDAGEFPFFPDEGMTQSAYEAVRASARQMICYIQGMESARCMYVSDDGTDLVDIGVQTFPG